MMPLQVIITQVDRVYAEFGQPTQHALTTLSVAEATRRLNAGELPTGSMGPKIEAVIRFLRSGGRRALITNPESLPKAIEGRAGTHFVGGV